jgi:hypothetical protein
LGGTIFCQPQKHRTELKSIKAQLFKNINIFKRFAKTSLLQIMCKKIKIYPKNLKGTL